MSLRHLSREIVVQALFTWDFYEQDSSQADEIFSFSLQERDKLHDVDFPKELFNGIIRKVDVLDDIIEKAAPAWPIERIASVPRNILRLGIYEMLFSDRDDVPPRVAINESIELAKSYGGPNAYKFVSGVLGAIYESSDLKDKDTGEGSKSFDPKTFPVSQKAGALVYAKNESGEIVFGFVHDIFGRWTLPKGSVPETTKPEEGVLSVVKDEIGVDVMVKDTIGSNEYLANDKEHGKIRKQVTYFLAEAPFEPLHIEKETSGLTEAQWFLASEVSDLNMYEDIAPILTEGVKALQKYLED